MPAAGTSGRADSWFFPPRIHSRARRRTRYYSRTMAGQHETQRIARLTALNDVLARIAALVAPVEARSLGLAAARGRVLAEDVTAGPCPALPMALRDGWAVNSALTLDAGPYAPARLPEATLVDVGEPLPAGA